MEQMDWLEFGKEFAQQGSGKVASRVCVVVFVALLLLL